MSKDYLKCQTCANQVNGFHCTMQLDMSEKSRVYKKCRGYIKYISKPKKIILVKKEKEDNSEFEGTDFGNFLRKGGHYSFRTGKYGIKDE